jgi:PAS domain S-box-containing protein
VGRKPPRSSPKPARRRASEGRARAGPRERPLAERAGSGSTDALQASEERYRLVARATKEVIWDWDLVAGTVYWSDSLQTLFGYTADEAGSRAEAALRWWQEHIHPADRTEVAAKLAAVTDGSADVFVHEYRFCRSNGSYATVVDRGHVVHDHAGRPIRMVGSMIDVSERKRAEDEARQRRREADVLAGLTREINASLDLDTVLQRVTEGARDLCRADLAEIALWDPGACAMVFCYWAGVRSDQYRAVQVEPGKGLGGRVIATGRPFRTEDYASDLRFGRDYVAEAIEEGLVAQLAVPISTRDHLGGLLYVGRRSARPFTEQDEIILTRLADHAAVAIGNARLYQDAERRRRAAQTLAKLGRLLSQSLDAEEVGRRIVESVCALSGAAAATLYRLEPGSGDLVAIAVSGQVGPRWHPGVVVRRGTGVSGVAVAERRPVATSDSLSDPRVHDVADILARVESASFRAVLAVPLLVQDRAIGALAIGKPTGHRFTDEETVLAQAFADHAALALENARLYQEAVTLEAVARQITSSLERDEVLRRIAESARKLCGCDLAFLAPYDAETDTATIVAAAGARSHALFSVRIAPGRGVGGMVLETGQPVATEDYLNDSRFSQDYMDAAREEGTVAQAVVPLRLGGAITGLLCAVNRTPRHFTTRDMEILSTLADQAAIALENSRLYAEHVKAGVELRARARQQAAVAELGQRALAGPDLDSLMSEALAVVAQTVDVEYCSVLELLPDGQTLRLRAGVGWAEGEVGRATVDAGPASPAGYALLSGEPVTTEDLGTETRFAVPAILRDHGVVSSLVVVIRGRDRPFGALSAHATRRRHFTSDDVQFVGSVANVLASALERRRAEDALRQHAARLTSLHEIDQAILAARSAEAIAQAAVEQVRRLVPCRRASVMLFDFAAQQAIVLAVETPGATALPAGTRRPLAALSSLDGLRTGEPRQVPDLRAAPPTPTRRVLMDEGIAAYLMVPLISRHELIGSLNLSRDVPGEFPPEQVAIAREVAASLAVAIGQARLHEAVRTGRERLRALSRRLVEIQEEERRHLARELHDEIGQLLTGLKLTLEISARPRAGEPDGLGQARDLVDDLIARVRDLSLDLRPAMLDDLGLLPALLWHLDRYSKQTSIRVHFEHGGIDRRFSPEVETAAYRIVQEALTNVARHAEVPEVTAWVWCDGEALNVHVEDAGKGFDPAATRLSGGLPGMRERAELLGGHLIIDSTSGAGTRVTAGIPLEVPMERRQASR